jgi:hypothetical protein
MISRADGSNGDVTELQNPYEGLPKSAYWRSGVAAVTSDIIPGLYRKKFDISSGDTISTFGSCFAQHIGSRMRSSGYKYIDLEPAPALLPEEKKKEFGYGVYSARYGNIYTIRQFVQLLDRAFGIFRPSDQVWEHRGRFYDPFRPTVEPNGFGSAEEVSIFHDRTMSAVRRIVKESSVIVFTLGLTEAWVSKVDGAVYPLCPGTSAGTFDPSLHQFHNFTVSEVERDLDGLIQRVKELNPKARWLLTVSPVPLTATASGDHVLVSTTYSKSVLRAVAGEAARRYGHVDYFPSYEIITGPQAYSCYFDENLRTVKPEGVDAVMANFFSEHPKLEYIPDVPQSSAVILDNDIVCEEGYLEKWAAK